jgi:signal transduction histidine kinase
MIDNFADTLSILLQGNIPERIDVGKIEDERERHLAEMLNQLITFMQEIHDFIIPLSKGELAEIEISRKNFFGSPFKELHSRLLHLAWQANQVANGDYSQRVDFMGDFSEAFNNMVDALKTHEKSLKNKIGELEKALAHIKNLEGILPICSHCKKIRLEGTEAEDQENWVQVESYISAKTDAKFSHSICPACLEKHYPDEEEQ